MNVPDALKQRFSARAFLDRPVARATVEQVLDAARHAPSGTNMQPWHVAVLTGKTKTALSDAIIEQATAGVKPHPEIPYYPDEWFEPYKSRRFHTGVALYHALGIRRDDTARRTEQWNLNYRFFGAPVGLLFFLDRRLGRGSLVDMGIFLQSLMLAAVDIGLGTCPQAAMADYPDVVRRYVDMPGDMALLAGMALGYPDPAHPVNGFRTEREPVAGFTRWVD